MFSSIAGVSLVFLLSWSECTLSCFTLLQRKERRGKKEKEEIPNQGINNSPVIQNAKHSIVSLKGCLSVESYTPSPPIGRPNSTKSHHVRSTAAILRWAPFYLWRTTWREQHTIAYIQYNQDWIGIRKIQVQNDYIREDSTSTKGYYS